MVAPNYSTSRQGYVRRGWLQPFFFGQADAHAMAYEFERRGISVEFRYPGEHAVSTLGSRCQLTRELTSMSKCSQMDLAHAHNPWVLGSNPGGPTTIYQRFP